MRFFYGGKVSEIMNARVSRVLAILESNVERQLDLSDIAREMNLSTSRLYHLFKGETGQSPTQLLKSLKLQRAKELLETTFLSIKEIMLQVGINDESHFIRDFKRVYELPPIRYRESYLQNALLAVEQQAFNSSQQYTKD